MKAPVQRVLAEAAVSLQGRAFEAYFSERRLSARGYRAVLLLPKNEHQLRSDLATVTRQLRTADSAIFSSFTEPTDPCAPSAPALWVDLDAVPLGFHWFQIKSLSLQHDEVIFRLKSLRYFPDREFTEKADTSSNNLGVSSSGKDSESKWNADFSFNKIDAAFMLGVIKFILAASVASIVGLFKVIEFVGEFTIKFMRESSIIIEKLTPLFFGGLNFLGRLSSAFLAFLTMLFRGDKPIRVQNFPAIDNRRNKRQQYERLHQMD